MFRKGLAVAVILLFVGVAFAPTINADIDKPIVETTQEEDVTPTPIVLVLQLMTKLRNHKDIQNVETEDNVIRLIESDEELNSIVEKLQSFDCGCYDDSRLEWPFPLICILLLPLWTLGLIAFFMGGPDWIGVLAGLLGTTFNCFWV